MSNYRDPNDFALPEQKWRAREVLSAREGTAYITIKGQNHPLFYIQKVEAKFKKNKVEVRAMGQRGVGSKTTSWKGTGTLVINEITSMFKQAFINYAKTGRDLFFDLKITNEDLTSGRGRETKILRDCNLDEITFAILDTEDAILKQEIPFTFEDVDLLETFSVVTSDDINEDNNY